MKNSEIKSKQVNIDAATNWYKRLQKASAD
jgi:hypothetical protein